MIFCRILISYAEFHANVLKTDFSKGNKTSFFLFSQIAQVKKVNRLQISQKSKNRTKISLTKLSYRIKSISLSLCVMKLFSSRVFTLTKAAPYPWKKPKNDMKMICHWLSYKIVWLIDLLLIDWCLLFPSYINISKIKKKRNNGAWRSTN